MVSGENLTVSMPFMVTVMVWVYVVFFNKIGLYILADRNAPLPNWSLGLGWVLFTKPKVGFVNLNLRRFQKAHIKAGILAWAWTRSKFRFYNFVKTSVVIHF